MASLEGLRDSPPSSGFLPSQSIMNTLCWVSPRLFPQLFPPLLHSQGCSMTNTPAQAGPTEGPPQWSWPCSPRQGCELALPQSMHLGSDLPSSISPNNQSAWTISHQLEELNLNIETKLQLGHDHLLCPRGLLSGTV